MSEPAREHIIVDCARPGVALITIDRARHFNTLSADTLDELGDAISRLSADEAIRSIVVRGDGDETFAAGANIREVSELTPQTALGFAARGQHVLDLIERARQIVFAAVTGYCMGGGLDLALACDVRIASPSSVFAHPGSRLGIITGFGGTSRLARTVGKAVAVEMFVTARRVDASEALAIGLVDAVVEKPVDLALERAASVAATDESSWRVIKELGMHAWRRGKPGPTS